ncbi:MAG TPA: general stress protein CsbD [Puia sp.]
MEKLINLEGSWHELMERVKEFNPVITDADFTFMEGREDELFEKLAIKLHQSKKEIKDRVENIPAC